MTPIGAIENCFAGKDVDRDSLLQFPGNLNLVLHHQARQDTPNRGHIMKDQQAVVQITRRADLVVSEAGNPVKSATASVTSQR